MMMLDKTKSKKRKSLPSIVRMPSDVFTDYPVSENNPTTFTSDCLTSTTRARKPTAV